jgi:predicted N-acetyltransferase YhbS
LLVGGLVLRAALEPDLPQVRALLAARGEPEDAEDLDLVVADGGLGSTAVVVDGERVVSTVTLLDETLWLGAVALPAGQVELVATDTRYEGRGLVRALMGWAHERSARRGHVVQVMVGIPYFYRQFGYEYAVPIPRDLRVVGPVPSVPGLLVRAAGLEDVAAMAALEDAEQAGFDVRMPHSEACWRWLVTRTGSRQWVVVADDGGIVATGRTTPPGEGVHLGEAAASTPEGARALLAHAVALGSGEATAKERPGTVAGEAVAPFLLDEGRPDWYYVRVPDPVVVLERLRPVLSARLRAAGSPDVARRDVLVSGWRWHVRFEVEPDGVGPMIGGGPERRPISQGGSGVAPDVLASLLFGPYGAAGLEERHPDVLLGEQRELMEVLFPPVRADVLTFYLP